MARDCGFAVRTQRRYAFLPRNLWGRLPAVFADSRLVAGLWGSLDAALGQALPWFCQNHLFVLERQG